MKFTLYLLLIILFQVVAGCSAMPEKTEAIFEASGIEVYPDSIILGGREYCARSPHEISNAWRTDSASLMPGPRLSSSSRMADALFMKALSEQTAGSFSPRAMDIWLSTAWMDPEKSMNALRLSAVGGPQTHPAVISEGLWLPAAWELYCVTGDRDWLREAWSLVPELLDTSWSPSEPVWGIPNYLSPTADYFPDWMQTVDLMQVRSLAASVMHYMSVSAAASMAGELGLKDDQKFLARAATLRNTINDYFWEPSVSRYGEYLYGDMYPILSGASDNIATALCALSGVATDEMIKAGVASCPVLPAGLPLVFPYSGKAPCLLPEVQALHGIAASVCRDPSALRQATASLWAMLLDAVSPSAWPALIMRGFLGASFRPDGLSFSPTVPSIIWDHFTISGLRYRNATLDITIRGTGDRIASVLLDETPLSVPVIPAELEGRHSVTLTLSGNSLHEHELTITDDGSAPAMPKVYWTNSREATILNHTQGVDYQIYVNGVLTETLTSPHYTISGGTTQVVDFVPVTTAPVRLSGFSPRSHVFAPETDIISVPATSITPRRPPLRWIKSPEIATKYIELAARHNTRLTFYVNAPSTGDYFLRIFYSNGGGETAVRSVEVNGRTIGSVACPPVRANDWITTRPSTTLTVPLREGFNKLSLYYVNSIILLNEIRLLKK